MACPQFEGSFGFAFLPLTFECLSARLLRGMLLQQSAVSLGSIAGMRVPWWESTQAHRVPEPQEQGRRDSTGEVSN